MFQGTTNIWDMHKRCLSVPDSPECSISELLSPVAPPPRFSGAALQPLLVHGGAPGHPGLPWKLSCAQLFGAQRRGHAGAPGVEERRHLHEPEGRGAAARASRRLAALHPRGPLQAQQARRGNLPVHRYHQRAGLHIQPHGAAFGSR